MLLGPLISGEITQSFGYYWMNFGLGGFCFSFSFSFSFFPLHTVNLLLLLLIEDDICRDAYPYGHDCRNIVSFFWTFMMMMMMIDLDL